VYNPGFEVATLRVPMTGLGLEANEELSVYEVYPAPGAVPTMIASGPELDVSLRPFELRCLELHWGAALAADIPVQERSPAQASSRLDLSLSEVIQEHSPSPRERTHVLRGSAVLPTLRRGDHLALVARLHRAGDWWYHPEPQTLVQLTARLNGLDVYCEVTPKSRSYNGPGAPWVVYDVAAGPAWTGQQLHVDLRAQLPRDISVTLEAHLYDAWWMRYPKRFAAR
jgi:hypothetical protein